MVQGRPKSAFNPFVLGRREDLVQEWLLSSISLHLDKLEVRTVTFSYEEREDILQLPFPTMIFDAVNFVFHQDWTPGHSEWPCSLPVTMHHPLVVAAMDFKWSKKLARLPR